MIFCTVKVKIGLSEWQIDRGTTMPAKRQVPAGGKAGGGRAAKRPAANKRQASANADVEDGEAVFLESDDEGRGKQQKAKRPGAVAEEDEDEEVQETAEEKRLRLGE
jgi:hypothetical protein